MSAPLSQVAISRLLKGYLQVGDLGEAARAVQDLHTPFFTHELVKKALTAALEQPQKAAAVVALLQQLATAGSVSSTQMAKGFARMVRARARVCVRVCVCVCTHVCVCACVCE